MYNGFESAWTRFSDLCLGKLIEKSRQSALTPAAATMAAKAAAGTWTDYSECGDWIKRLRAESPQKADRVLELIDGISFKEVEVSAPISDAVISAAALGGSAIGAGVSSLLKWNTAGVILSAVVPAAVLFPSMKKIKSIQVENNREKLINGYMQQLSELKRRIAETIGQ
ncbi:MAG: hypothetical protein NC394_04380 [Bacteroides sp.]|nr:hypothetical protein [Bacteroides sp.]